MNKEYISFTPLGKDTAEKIIESASDEISKEELEQIIAGLLDLNYDGVEVAVSLISDALLIRIYDNGEYIFPCPVGLIDGWDFKRAVRLIADYTVKEMIPLSFSEIMREDLVSLGEVFRSMDARAYEDDDDLFAVRVRNECMRLGDYPTLYGERITLGEIDESSLSEYAALCRDDENNKYWGYDVKEDNTLDTDEFFLEIVRHEFMNGISLTLGAFYNNRLIGEGVLYAFDYAGAASVAVRILSEYHGCGLGGETLSLLISEARNMGLLELYAEVKLENERSIAMTRRYMEEYFKDSEKVYFRLEL